MTRPRFTADASLSGPIGHHAERRIANADFSAHPGEMKPTGPAPLLQPAIEFNIIYGNWCGNNRGSGPAIDRVDAVCRRHDKCYDSRGNLDCSCDRELLRRMPGAIAHSSTSGAGRRAGRRILAFFVANPVCLCHRICLPFLGCRRAPFPVPGLPPFKRCPAPYA
jgi:hypothetical protein